MNTYNHEFLTATSLSASFNGPAMQIANYITYAVVAKVTGTPTGTFHLEASLDPFDANPNYVPGNFNTITGTSQAVTTSGLTTWNLANQGYTYVRIAYVDGSSGASTATVSVRINAKG